MKNALLFLFILSTSNGYCQWNFIYSFSDDQGCIMEPLNVGLKFLSPSEAYWIKSRGRCSPTSPGYFYIFNTNNSFSSTNLLLGGDCAPYGNSLVEFYPVSYDTLFMA